MRKPTRATLLAGFAALLALTPNTIWPLAPAPAFAQSANDAAEKEAFEASKSLGTAEAWNAFLKNYPTGFRADLAKAYIKKLESEPSAGAPAPSSAVAAADTVNLNATPIRVGKWPERAAYDGRSLWVSESGNRSIVEIDVNSRAVGRRLKVGRLPVDMVATENGTVYALSETDNMIYARTSGDGSAGEFAQVPRCANILAYAADVLWAVSDVDCSAPSVLTRVSHLNGRAAKVADLAGGPVDMKAAHGNVYVGHMSSAGRAAFVSVIDARSGSATASPDLPIHYPRMAANGDGVYVGGAPLDQNVGIVLKLNPGQAEFAVTQRLPEPIAALGATNQYVIAAARNGTIFILSPGNLALVRTINTGQPIQPHDVLAIGNTLVVVSSAGNEVASDNAVYLIDGWLPGSAPPAAFVAPRAPVRSEPVAEKPAELKCASGYKKVGGKCVVLQNCGANAYRSPEGDCYCNKNYVMQNGKCVRKQVKAPVRDNCPGDSVLKNGKCVKEAEPEMKPPINCTGGQLYSLSQQRCVCQDGLKWNGQRCTL